MRVYLAGPYAARDHLRGLAEDIRRGGLICTSSWLEEIHTIGAGTLGPAAAISDIEIAVHAKQDLFDIDYSEAVVLFTATSLGLTGTAGSSGGRHVETGYAIAREKPVIIVGEPENVFHRLGTVCTLVANWTDALSELHRLADGGGL